jgi:hypothetical protein
MVLANPRNKAGMHSQSGCQSTHKNARYTERGLCAFVCVRVFVCVCAQVCARTEIVVGLFGQLLLRQPVQDEEFLGQDVVL